MILNKFTNLDKFRQIQLFLFILWHGVDSFDGKTERLDIKTAWEISRIVWSDKSNRLGDWE